jgi:lipopolysaccharide/colanic/teichoic acid biosynthesis glycosyltransferase
VRGPSYYPLKRLFDVLSAAFLLALTSPIQAIVALLVRRDLGTPVVFRQQRPGKDGVVFELVKFRTMKDPDPSLSLVTDEERLTPFGTWLRSTSLDELPTLWNVLCGDMSVVGPRPLLVRYLDRYSAEQARRHEVRPGITGLAQVSGRNAVDWEERFRLDVEYVDLCSPLLDARIVWATIQVVLRRRGVAAEGSATMPEFGVNSEQGR